MKLIDSHAHLTAPGISEQVDRVLTRAADSGVEQIISVATDLADARRVLALAEVQKRVFAAIGLHPHEAGKLPDDPWTPLDELLRHPKVVAFGEMGLDYHYDFTDRTTQQRVFARQLEIAAPRDLPLVIHCREAVPDTVEMLRQHGFEGRPVVFHCFSGMVEEAAEIARQGWRISFTGMVTFKKSTALQAIAAGYPADRLMLETDCPYLSPEPVRQMRPNEPANLRHLASFLADLRGVPLEDLAEETSANARAFFKLPNRSEPRP